MTRTKTETTPAPEPLLREEALARFAAAQVADNKGEDVVVLDVRGRSSVADFFVIGQGRSTRHVQGMVDKIQQALEARGARCLGVEGEAEGQWVLLDYDEVVVHLFYEPVRRFYDLEGLWREAPRLDLGTPGGAAAGD
ncbi:ribosome silencing factor [Dissulfurirhabdus thermomarina]|uniref:Ribosomal silencing factor RsfS n=1 Tax=Dissulfurirhabdus thermomarina TaxID=1765737 RepID=A0A6N9TQ03_DISTH|nr:ribosome silencing factor [Dissulfurirhabdus thermomarina]NDY43249.1 ribosome silencing factor [Dissulfurirhabdus thermomarina]NMX22591.1 ribosome silencing factor [Dissulfurirhabdus thermomarina]